MVDPVESIRPVIVGGWPLAFLDATAEPRIRDLDLGERLGYERPRELIVRLVEGGFSPGIQQRPTVRRYEIRPGIEHSQLAKLGLPGGAS
jgi:hypothetical protein